MRQGLGLLLLACLVLGGAAAPASAGDREARRIRRQGPGNAVFPTEPDLRVGSDDCEDCHDEADGFQDPRATAHLPLFLEGRKPAHLAGCEACHGPAAEHVKRGDRTKIAAFSDLSPRERSRICLQCHGGQRDRVQFARSAHDLAQVACTDCHRVHDPDAAPRPDEACFSCHSEVRADFALPHHHPLEEGVVGCVDCHAQHGAFAGRLRRLNGEAACGQCHAEKQGPFVHEHVPRLMGGCLGCHAAHGSANPRQLVRHDVNALCLECHVNTSEDHDQADGLHSKCVICHSQIHGSNVDPRFME